MGGSGGRGGKPPPGGREATAPAIVSSDPIVIMERELPSLRNDLFLTGKQIALWTAFEREVRDAAQLTRARERMIYAARNFGPPGSAPSQPNTDPIPDAAGFLQHLAEDDRVRAEIMADLVARFKVLYVSLNDNQKSSLEKRFALALRDPLRM
jgi:hypothetical protein